MRIGIDVSALRHPMGGYERYVRALLAALVALPGDHELVVFTDGRYGTRLLPAGGSRLEHRPVWTPPLFIVKGLLQDQTYWPSVLRRAGLDVLHSPIFAGMTRAPYPYVLTVHDLIAVQSPQAFSRSAAWYWRTVLPRAVARASVIITDSEYVRGVVRSHFNLPPDRVVAIPLGVEAHFGRVDDRATLADVRDRYALPPTFLLFVGIASPRKNLDRLLDAFTTMPVAARGDAHIVIAGPAGWKNEAFDRALARSPLASRILRLGVVPEADLPALYTLARGVVNLSAAEGFGLPALEALACGTPLLCAATSAFPELVGDCALLVDPTDEAAVVRGLATLVAGGRDVSTRAARGVQRAAAFTWRRTAEETLAVYRRAVG